MDVRGVLHKAIVQVSYCEEKVDCRRVMIMGHFGEQSFTERQCNRTCDNCQNSEGAEHETRDMTQAIQIPPFLFHPPIHPPTHPKFDSQYR